MKVKVGESLCQHFLVTHKTNFDALLLKIFEEETDWPSQVQRNLNRRQLWAPLSWPW